MRLSRPVLWIAGSAGLGFSAFGGLCALAPLDYTPPQLKFFLSLFLFILFWIGWLTLAASLICWIISKLFP
jgi:hypothetical protein